MKYRYFYQTSRNENRDGWIEAPNRAEAYAALRKRGIKPYRLAGDDPSPWRKRILVSAAAAAPVVAAIAAFCLAVAWRGTDDPDHMPLRRMQLAGSAEVIFGGIANCWDGVFSTRLDRRLAAYAQPGWIAIPPDDEAGIDYAADLAAPLEFPDGEVEELRMLRRIVAGMRKELESYVASGGTIEGYMQFLDERQDEEASFRRKAFETVEKTDAAHRERVKIDMNARLRAMGFAEL